MKRIVMTGMLMALAALSACGGGGGTTAVAVAPAAISYTGVVTPAVVTSTNANALAGNVSGNTNTANTLAVGAVSATPKRANVTKHLPQLTGLTRQLLAGSSAAPATGAIVAINQQQLGPLGGSVTLLGQIDNVTGTGTLTASFNAYQDIGNVTVSGAMTVTVLSVDAVSGAPVDMSLTFSALTISDPAGSISVSGTMRDQITLAANQEVITVNFVAQDNVTLHQVKLQNFVIDDVFDNINAPTLSSTLISGRVFDSVDGYVDIITVRPMVTNNLLVDQFPSSGVMVLSGSAGVIGGATAVQLTALSALNVLVEADTSGDGVYDYSSGVIAWTAL